MKHSLTRRGFLAALPMAALAETAPLKITAVEIWELRGHRDSVRGVDQQYQVNPLDIYEELRQKPYRDAPTPVSGKAAATALYLKIVTEGGLEIFTDPSIKRSQSWWMNNCGVPDGRTGSLRKDCGTRCTGQIATRQVFPDGDQRGRQRYGFARGVFQDSGVSPAGRSDG